MSEREMRTVLGLQHQSIPEVNMFIDAHLAWVLSITKALKDFLAGTSEHKMYVVVDQVFSPYRTLLDE